jgi:hypothetical protein
MTAGVRRLSVLDLKRKNGRLADNDAMSIPRPPAGMGPAGRVLWRSVLRDFELGAHEQLMLLQACHVADVCGALQEVIDADGPMLASSDGSPRTHPA